MPRKRLLDPIHPGEILLEDFMKPLGISINKLARDIAVPPGRISTIVNGKRAITADTALRLGKYLGVSSELWLGLQADFDLRMARRTVGPEIDKRFSWAEDRDLSKSSEGMTLEQLMTTHASELSAQAERLRAG